MENYNDVQAMRKMPKYLCHKEVWALKIASISIGDDKIAVIVPKEDGYASWSPSKAFEEGYSLKEEV